jgi:hypothetical protein
MITTHRSRVRIHGHVQHNKRKTKTHSVNQKQGKSPVAEPNIRSGAKVTVADKRKAPRPFLLGSPASEEDEGAIVSDEDVEEEVEEEVPTFTKKRVASAEEVANSSYMRSSLRAAVDASHVPSAADESAIQEVESESPWASLLLETPVVDGVATPVSSSKPSGAQGTKSPAGWLRTIVSLFAGRKKPARMDKGKQHHRASPSPTTPATERRPPRVETTQQTEPERPATPPTPPPSPSPPRLTHRETIPSVQPPSAKDPAHRRGYRDEPCAPLNHYMGYSILAKDVFEPEHVVRGFEAPVSPVSSPESSLRYRRNQSDLSLFDRKDDKWMQWHMKHPTRESMPFSRTHSEVDLTHLNTNGVGTRRGRSSHSSASSGRSSGIFPHAMFGGDLLTVW